MENSEGPQDHLTGLAKKMHQVRSIATDFRFTVLELVVVIGVIDRFL